eukprot:TRINITY_DN2375_c0_g1_i3.p1 TRINITY_DN2375_c0_g1~~TRINITY_DN2375_c0_g1_i3.p1  ORF type:complete len:459 (-),score=237.23 TRINITY_DN2375_c0_g1_i3:35-1411(-)
MEKLMVYVKNYMADADSKAKKMNDLEEEMLDLKAENESYEKQFEEMVEEYEKTINSMKEEKKLKHQENITNLQTLVTELSSIEETNAELMEQLETEKKNSLGLMEESAIQKRIIHELEEKMKRRASESQPNSSPPSSQNGEQSDLVKHLLKNMTELSNLATQMKQIINPQLAEEEKTNAEKLQAEKLSHEETKKALDQAKRRMRKKKKELDKRVNNLLAEKEKTEAEAPPAESRPFGTLRKGLGTLRRRGGDEQSGLITGNIYNNPANSLHPSVQSAFSATSSNRKENRMSGSGAATVKATKPNVRPTKSFGTVGASGSISPPSASPAITPISSPPSSSPIISPRSPSVVVKVPTSESIMGPPTLPVSSNKSISLVHSGSNTPVTGSGSSTPTGDRRSVVAGLSQSTPNLIKDTDIFAHMAEIEKKEKKRGFSLFGGKDKEKEKEKEKEKDKRKSKGI